MKALLFVFMLAALLSAQGITLGDDWTEGAFEASIDKKIDELNYDSLEPFAEQIQHQAEQTLEILNTPIEELQHQDDVLQQEKEQAEHQKELRNQGIHSVEYWLHKLDQEFPGDFPETFVDENALIQTNQETPSAEVFLQQQSLTDKVTEVIGNLLLSGGIGGALNDLSNIQQQEDQLEITDEDLQNMQEGLEEVIEQTRPEQEADQTVDLSQDLDDPLIVSDIQLDLTIDNSNGPEDQDSMLDPNLQESPKAQDQQAAQDALESGDNYTPDQLDIIEHIEYEVSHEQEQQPPHVEETARAVKPESNTDAEEPDHHHHHSQNQVVIDLNLDDLEDSEPVALPELQEQDQQQEQQQEQEQEQEQELEQAPLSEGLEQELELEDYDTEVEGSEVEPTQQQQLQSQNAKETEIPSDAHIAEIEQLSQTQETQLIEEVPAEVPKNKHFYAKPYESTHKLHFYSEADGYDPIQSLPPKQKPVESQRAEQVESSQPELHHQAMELYTPQQNVIITDTDPKQIAEDKKLIESFKSPQKDQFWRKIKESSGSGQASQDEQSGHKSSVFDTPQTQRKRSEVREDEDFGLKNFLGRTDMGGVEEMPFMDERFDVERKEKGDSKRKFSAEEYKQEKQKRIQEVQQQIEEQLKTKKLHKRVDGAELETSYSYEQAYIDWKLKTNQKVKDDGDAMFLMQSSHLRRRF